MTQDVSGAGLKVNVIADKTFPSGFIVTEFADDADPFDTPVIAIAEKAMGLNGDLIIWSKGAPLDVVINVIPDGEDDDNLSALLEANRVAKGKSSAKDAITLVKIGADGRTTTFQNGRLTNGPVDSSISSAGRKKTKAYTFTFENKSGGK